MSQIDSLKDHLTQPLLTREQDLQAVAQRLNLPVAELSLALQQLEAQTLLSAPIAFKLLQSLSLEGESWKTGPQIALLKFSLQAALLQPDQPATLKLLQSLQQHYPERFTLD